MSLYTMKKVITIVGPTASGKSDLGVKIAKEIDGEIISADSRQVYIGLDIGSGKITPEEMECIRHHMLDVEDPKNIFSVGEYTKMARSYMEDIWKRGKNPIVVGGTGFYIDSLINNREYPNVPENYKLREELSLLSKKDLQKKLETLDPDRYETIDKDNPVRLIRAIEIASVLGKVPTVEEKEKEFELIQVGIKVAKDILENKIHERLYKRVEEGMVEEVERLHRNGLSYERMEDLGLEYRYVSRYIKGELSKEEMLKELESEIHKYAKRQMTWFRKNKDIVWFEDKKKALDYMKKHVTD
ncbi:MAG: tRNA (adenosine(37)-N6)-dimethylallyltransferase MiaA [Candidatus Pacebacteria bacterium]|nr:tRNA (adenosine(37)-N6)-dimethylallyltransferase MiaA [Candidatus Paceibacterota bacterium]